MTDAPDSTAADQAATPIRHTREELLRLLRDDPRDVSRAEIKAAFQDGRLGDQDLDIPTLAAMRRITELLTEPQPASDLVGGPPPTAAAAGLPRSGTRPRGAVEAELAALRDTIAQLERSLASTTTTAERARDELVILTDRVDRPAPVSSDGPAPAETHRLAAAALAAALLSLVVALIALVVVLGR